MQLIHELHGNAVQGFLADERYRRDAIGRIEFEGV
jgi:hypothetical protein